MIMILVTGASGFIGRELVARLSGKKLRVRALVRNREDAGLFPKGVETFVGDITRPQTLSGAFTDVDTVVHLAGAVSYSMPKEELFRINAIGTKNLLDFSGSVKKFVLASSVSVYGEIKGEADENYPLGPLNAYGESKIAAERFVKQSGIPHAILRIAPVYGKGSPSWMKNLKLLRKGFPVPKTGNLTHIVHVSDAAQGLELGIKKGSGIYNIAGPEPVPFMDFAKRLVTLLGRKPRVLPFFVVKALAAAAGLGKYLRVLAMNRYYFTEKAEKELGYRPRADFNKEIKAMVDWFNNSA